MEEIRNDKTALVLSGGALKGIAQVGIYKAIQELGVKIDGVFGTSAGAINAALIAKGLGWKETLDVWKNYACKAFKLNFKGFFLRGLYGLDDRVARKVYGETTTFKHLTLPCYITAVRLDDCSLQVFTPNSEVPVYKAVLASSAIPGIFTPVNINGVDHVDGGLRSALPVSVAISAGYSRFILIDLGFSGKCPKRMRNLPEIVTETFEIMLKDQLETSLKTFFNMTPEEAEVGTKSLIMIKPRVYDIGLTDYDKLQYGFEKGYQVGKQTLQNWSAQWSK